MSHIAKIVLSLATLVAFMGLTACGPKVDMSYAKPFPATTTMQNSK